MHAGNAPCHYWDGERQWSEHEEYTDVDARRRAAEGYTMPGWYFWDESEAFVVGPFRTKEEGETARKEYEP